MVNMTNRKIQKLGSSSLVITIPKSWATRLGLKAGDKVVVVDEGDHLKIMPYDPLSTSNKTTIRLPFKKVLENEEVTKSLIKCLYLCGIERVELFHVTGNGNSVENLAKILERTTLCKPFKLNKISRSVIELKFKCPQGDPRSSLKVLNSKIHEILTDMAFGALGDEEKKKKVLEKTDELKRFIDENVRSILHFANRLGSNDTGMCGFLFLISSLRSVGNIIELMARSLQSIKDPRAVGYISALRAALSDVLGGVAAGSFRRILRARSLSLRIKSIMENQKEKNNIFYGLLLSLSTLIISLTEEAVCSLFIVRS